MTSEYAALGHVSAAPASDRVVCADGLPEAVLAGRQCAVPNCRRWFAGQAESRVIGYTAVDGDPVRVCADHRDEDVLEPVR